VSGRNLSPDRFIAFAVAFPLLAWTLKRRRE